MFTFTWFRTLVLSFFSIFFLYSLFFLFLLCTYSSYVILDNYTLSEVYAYQEEGKDLDMDDALSSYGSFSRSAAREIRGAGFLDDTVLSTELRHPW